MMDLQAEAALYVVGLEGLLEVINARYLLKAVGIAA